ncbi:MAG TPA: hypothetical protein PLV06_10160 [Bacteroidales bacterium]|nr:hypothetical protein [Bacteroidales bacterium]HPF03465.1 hypothetical protein [Bacteroidales bacterium]HPJ60403.1 hypothetical protein [Bacteroidales bacterium]HPR12737.1 hypothetical protein [Bacteroidales bacterium]HRW85607.1 hypothetical protein [Bacteroidales bacterium]
MKTMLHLFLSLSLVLAAAGCTGGKKEAIKEEQAPVVPDTGYTGIKQYKSGMYTVSEVTFKNGVRHGLMKTFYQGGQLRYTFWYENGLRQDSARWYFLEGQLFRTTPYKNDTVDGIQKQYYRTGKLRAEIGFSKGMRIPYIREYTADGRLMGSYPEIVINVNDRYAGEGLYRVNLSLSDNGEKVTFYRGDFTDGRFDTTIVKAIKTTKGKASVDLKKGQGEGLSSLSVIAEILTPLGNKYLTGKKIELPYNDLK